MKQKFPKETWTPVINARGIQCSPDVFCCGMIHIGKIITQEIAEKAVADRERMERYWLELGRLEEKRLNLPKVPEPTFVPGKTHQLLNYLKSQFSTRDAFQFTHYREMDYMIANLEAAGARIISRFGWHNPNSGNDVETVFFSIPERYHIDGPK